MLMLAIVINKRKKKTRAKRTIKDIKGKAEEVSSPNTYDLSMKTVLWNVQMKFPTYYFR